jgi:hypothetical protein
LSDQQRAALSVLRTGCNLTPRQHQIARVADRIDALLAEHAANLDPAQVVSALATAVERYRLQINPGLWPGLALGMRALADRVERAPARREAP